MITFPQSSWFASIVIPHQPHFIGQPDDVTVLWGYGLFVDKPGDQLRGGVLESLRTLVAVPTLLTTAEEIAEQVERLEIHHLASSEGDLHFALLTDWVDADVDRAEGDAELVAVARDGIERLNRRYGPALAGPRFLLLHRLRRPSAGDHRAAAQDNRDRRVGERGRIRDYPPAACLCSSSRKNARKPRSRAAWFASLCRGSAPQRQRPMCLVFVLLPPRVAAQIGSSKVPA